MVIPETRRVHYIRYLRFYYDSGCYQKSLNRLEMQTILFMLFT